MSYLATMSQPPVPQPSLSSGSGPSTTDSGIGNQFYAQNYTSPCSSPLQNENDHFLSDSPKSPIADDFDSSKGDHSDSVFWNSAPFSGENHFKSPTTKTINDLIESPIINKKIIHKKDSTIPARRLAFESPEIARVELSSHRTMTAGSNSTVEFDSSPEAPKVLPRATRAARMLERANAANLMLRSSPQLNPNQSRASLPSGYRFGTRSSASFSAPSVKSSNPQTSSQTLGETSPKRSSNLASFGTRGKAFIRALKNSESQSSAPAPENKDNDKEKQGSVVESSNKTNNVHPERADDEATVLESPMKEDASNLKRKSILKQLNPTSEVLSSPRTASGRRINFCNPIVTEHLYDRCASAKHVSESSITNEETEKMATDSEDNEENVSLNVKTKNVAGFKRRRGNDFTVVPTDTTAGDDNDAISDETQSTVTSQSSTTDDTNLAVNDDDDEEPKKKVCKKLNQLFDETDDWDILEVNESSQQSQMKITLGEEQVTAKNEEESAVENQSETETKNIDDSKQIEIGDNEIHAQQLPQNSEASESGDELKTKQVDEVSSRKESTVINRSPFGMRKTRAMAMVSSVMGDRAAQILVPVASSSPPVKQRQSSTFISGSGAAASPISRLSRSYALVQATKKKQEDLVKSISEAASRPDLFETPEKSILEKRSCLKSSDSEKRESRRLSFAKTIVTDQLYYCISEPSSCVAEALSLRKKASNMDENSSSSSSSSSSDASSDNPQSITSSLTIAKKTTVFESNQLENKETIVSPTKRRVLRQSSIISNEALCQDDETEEDESILDKSINLSNDEFVPETDDEDGEERNENMNFKYIHNEQTIESENENSFDSQTIADEMRTLAQDLTGHDVSNLSETSAFKVELSNLNTFECDVSASFSSDESTSTENNSMETTNISIQDNNSEDEDKDKENDNHNIDLNNTVESPSTDEEANELQSDISDSCYKDASSIFEDITLDSSSSSSSKSSHSSPIASESLNLCSRQRIVSINQNNPLSGLSKEQLDNEPKVKLELPLSVARYVFDLLKVSLEPFQES